MTDYYPEDADEADKLIGLKLKDGWTVSERITRKAKQTGGAFSYGYIVRRDQQEAYLKAFDFERVFQSDDPMKELEKAVKSFNFEVEVLELCARFQYETDRARHITRRYRCRKRPIRKIVLSVVRTCGRRLSTTRYGRRF
jgi:hypothetical protein